MAGVKRKIGEVKKETQEDETVLNEPVAIKLASSKVVHITPENIIGALNSAVANINAVFQLRDQLHTEINVIKEELALANEVKIEASKLENLKREQDEFLYEYQIKKTRLEHELEEKEEEQKQKLSVLADEQKLLLKTQVDVQSMKLKLEKEEHERKLKLEREDWQREQALFKSETAEFGARKKSFEEREFSLREDLKKELDRDNAHSIEVLKLNHMKEIELLKGELKLEQANLGRYEAMLKELRMQNEKMSEQIASLSKEALASASSSALASKLKDVITQMPHGMNARTSV